LKRKGDKFIEKIETGKNFKNTFLLLIRASPEDTILKN
jgi:hypothetical protein